MATINVGTRQVPARCIPRDYTSSTSPHEFRFDAEFEMYYCIFCLLELAHGLGGEASQFAVAVNPVQTELHP